MQTQWVSVKEWKKQLQTALEELKAISKPIEGKESIAQVAAISSGDARSRSINCRSNGTRW